MFAWLVPVASPVSPAGSEGNDQEYSVVAGTTPFTPSAGDTVNKLPLHELVVMFVIAGPGLTVTVTVKSGPGQDPEVGITVYVAVCGELDEFTSVPNIFDSFVPAAPPVIPPVTEGAGQLYVVPTGTSPLVGLTGVTLKATPLHVLAVISVIAGLGLTVTTTSKSAPGQLPDVGVTV